MLLRQLNLDSEIARNEGSMKLLGHVLYSREAANSLQTRETK
jgi:hypothetical protein